jgi:hypothetical protein
MLLFDVPVSNHLTELSDAVVDKVIFVVVSIADDFPEKVRHLRLERWLFGVLAKLAKALEFFNSHLFRGDLSNLVEHVVDVLLIQPNSDFINDLIDLKSIVSCLG